MDTHNLQAFLLVAETGSFSIAAQRLHLTQPAVSKRVALLEQQVAARASAGPMSWCRSPSIGPGGSWPDSGRHSRAAWM